MNRVKIDLPSIRLKLYKQVPVETGTGFKSIECGVEIVDLVAHVDPEALACDMGSSAARNKSGKSIEAHGAVVVCVVGRRRV